MSSVSVVVLLLFAVGIIVGTAVGSQLPPNTIKSRFDYEYKVLLKLVMLNVGQNMCKEANKQQDAQIKLLQQKIDDLMKNQRSSTGSVYTRWGRTTCPVGATLVYSGYTAGSHYTHSGSTNPLCLPKNPDWGFYTSALDGGALVYGAEYELNNNKYFPEIDQSKKLQEHDVPCAVCKTPRSSTIMVPGKNQCQPGWHLEYKGYLMGDHYNHADSHEYTCVDGAPETLNGGVTNHNGYLLYMVEARCGSLKCPPYVNGRELTCAVCSQ